LGLTGAGHQPLRHQVPDSDLANIVERAVDLVLDETLKQRFAQRTAPSKARAVDAPEKRQEPKKEADTFRAPWFARCMRAMRDSARS
jgi:hypothetical protein